MQSCMFAWGHLLRGQSVFLQVLPGLELMYMNICPKHLIEMERDRNIPRIKVEYLTIHQAMLIIKGTFKFILENVNDP